jgi:hypothetical protein
MLRIIPLLIVLLIFYACTDIFSTRENDVEKPNPNSGIFEPATDAEIVLRNFSLAIQSRNLEEYKKVFSNPAVDDNGSPLFFYFGNGNFNTQILDGVWDYQDETNFAEDLFSESSLRSVQFSYSDTIPNPIPFDENYEETDFFRYRLRLSFFDSPPLVFRGQARFKLFRSEVNSQLWYIYEWYDESDGSDSTFSLLKLEGPK